MTDPPGAGCVAAVKPAQAEVEADRTPERGQIGRAPPVAAVNGPAGPSAIRAATAGSRALRGDGQKTRVLARDLFDAAARHRTELVHAPFYGVRCVTLQTSAQTRSIHANCGRAALLVEFKASGVQQRLGVPRLCRFFARPRSRTGSRRQGCPKLRLLATGSQLSDRFPSTKSAGEPSAGEPLGSGASASLRP